MACHLRTHWQQLEHWGYNMAADDIAKGALHLIRWGKKLAPATADEIAEFGPQAARVKALMSFIPNMSDDATWLTQDVANALQNKVGLQRAFELSDLVTNVGVRQGREDKMRRAFSRAFETAHDRGNKVSRYIDPLPSGDAAYAEALSDFLIPGYGRAYGPGAEAYSQMTAPLATARRFDMTVPNAPESFTNAARTLGERGLITGPKDVELARRISMQPAHIQEMYFNLLQEGTDPVELLAAMKALGM
jgi:hypothetical protein